MTILGVLADTHIPDRVRGLHPDILLAFVEAEVDAILHAGDVSVPGVLQELEEIAPVYAVRGNRDWVWLRHLPHNRFLDFEGVDLVLEHGHGRWRNYMVDRTHYFIFGMQEARYRNRLLASYPQVRVIVYGHLHIPDNSWVGDQLLFNPGSASIPEKEYTPSVGLLKIRSGGEVEGEILKLS
jgi:putative phosphoesterase